MCRSNALPYRPAEVIHPDPMPSSELESLTGKEARTVVFGHLLRGGTPASFDRLLALCFGAASVRALDHGQPGITFPPDRDTILTARVMGISFGD